MKIKIELLIDKKHAHLLLNSLRHTYSQTGATGLSKIISDIEKDVGIETQIAEMFIGHLSAFTPKKVFIDADLKYHLSFSPNWLAHPNGLARVCNETLMKICDYNGGSYHEVRPKDVKSKKLVKDVVKILIENYAA